MKSIAATLWAEVLKVRKSKVFWFSMVFFVFISFMMGLIMFIQIHPEISREIRFDRYKSFIAAFWRAQLE